MKSFSLILRNEWRIMIADKSLILVCTLLTLLLVYAVFIGLSEAVSRDDRVRKLVSQQEQKQSGVIEQIQRIVSGHEKPDVFANPLNPALVGSGLGSFYAIMPSSALSPLALGQSDLLPDHYKVSTRNKTTFMYQAENESPWNLLTGRFDPVFVLVYLLPLFIFAISYNLLSSEKEQSTLRMQLSNSVTLQTLMLGKLFARLVPVLGVAILAIIVPFLIFRGDAVKLSGELPHLAVIILIIGAYGFFWFTVTFFVNSFGFSSASNAMILVGTWVFLVLVAPVLLNVFVSRMSPAPSRIELATETRLITIDGLNRYHELLSSDYRHIKDPSMLVPNDGKFEVPKRLKAFYLINKVVDEKIEILLGNFESRLRDQQDLVERFGFVSPSVLAYEGLVSLAGTGTRRYQDFKQQVNDYHREWKEFFEPRIMSGRIMTQADFEKLPRFTWQESDVSMLLAGGLIKALQIFLITIVLFALGFMRLAKADVL